MAMVLSKLMIQMMMYAALKGTRYPQAADHAGRPYLILHASDRWHSGGRAHSGSFCSWREAMGCSW